MTYLYRIANPNALEPEPDADQIQPNTWWVSCLRETQEGDRYKGKKTPVERHHEMGVGREVGVWKPLI